MRPKNLGRFFVPARESATVMPEKFSQKLIVRTQKYFLEKHGLSLSVETTIAYLDSLADLYESFAVMAKAAPDALAAEPPRSDPKQI